ncbi:nucleoside/nucleotide kinase family protein [Gordonia amarae]|nr:hypothetical protein [Gordonia amarae]MCS3877001.1 pantothenate kinase [Gordonia amarae]QHN15821.1 nucleoside/nucleotide kinase family protein [Gordonia amarae]QHN20389.1 nucleoside/nucleotide kinase family protein [Gordonia amarae]QHN29241.1 nucleoside/nucleotide kinase family protein [Gordonia amarae]QHN38020.1 nucleoside/nucleotide kinase family protein [Gordonia amarae]
MVGMVRTTAGAVVSAIAEQAVVSDRTVVVGLVGPPGVGKTYSASRIAAALNALGLPATVLAMDGFHLSNAQLDRLGLRQEKGSPQTFDVWGLIELLHRIRRPGRTAPIFIPDYRRDLHDPIAATGLVDPDTRVVVVEGNYLLLDESPWGGVRPLLDVTWYLDAPDDVRRERLLLRHVAGGRLPHEAAAWVTEVDTLNATTIERTAPHARYLTDATRIDDELTLI